MFTILKEKENSVTNIQKLIISTKIERFKQFQYVFVNLIDNTNVNNNRSSSKVICQIVKKPDVNENYCYINTDVIHYSTVNDVILDNNLETVNISDNTDMKVITDTDLDKLETINISDNTDMKLMTDQFQKLYIKSNSVSEDTSQDTGVTFPNIFKNTLNENRININNIEDINEKLALCKKINVSIIMTSQVLSTNNELIDDDFNKLIKQIISMYIFKLNSYININVNNIKYIIVHSEDFNLSTSTTTTATSNLPKSYNNNLLYTSNTTKISIQNVFSIDYYKQYLEFNVNNNCCLEFEKYDNTWKLMKNLINCRKNSLNLINSKKKVYTHDRKLNNIANKVLLIGSTGSGKTFMIKHISRACAVPLVTINGNEFSSSTPGDSEENLRKKFKYAQSLALENKGLCILLIEQIHDLVPISSHLSHLTRLSLQLTQLLDNNSMINNLFIIFTTTHAHLIHSRLKSHLQLYLETPNDQYKQSMFEYLLKNINEKLYIKNVENKFSNKYIDMDRIIELTNSYLPTDIVHVSNIVQTFIVDRKYQFTNDELIKHLTSKLRHYRPSSLKTGLGVIEKSSNSNIEQLGGLKHVKRMIQKTVEWPFLYYDKYIELGIPKSKGILLYGPPGCAKTSLVRSMMSSNSVNVLAISAAQLYSSYVGEAEQNVVQLFNRARLSQPSILFIDEIDALVGNRSESSSKDIQQSVLSVFLNEMDGVGVKVESSSAKSSNTKFGGVMVIAATNRPNMLDSALIRPGRLDKLIYVPPPNLEDREDILKKVSAKGKMGSCVDFKKLALLTDLYSGADLCNLYREAALLSMLDKGFENDVILNDHWMSALKITKPSLTQQQLKYYEQFQDNFT